MQESLFLILNYVRMIWRFRWLALASATVLCLVGWAGVTILPDQYQVTTKVFLDTNTMLRPLLRGLAVDSIREDSSLMMRRTLLSRPNLEDVARKTDMDLNAKTPTEFELLLADLGQRISVSGTSRDNIFVISYTDKDPKLATRVVEALLNIFVEQSLGESRKDTSKSREFLEKQIREYESKLEAAEERLKEFKQRNVGLMPSEGSTYFSRLEEMNAKLSEVELQLTEARRRRDTLAAQIEGEEPSFGMGPPPTPTAQPQQQLPVTTPFDERITAMETKLDGLLLQYTDQHPDVIASRRLLDELKEQRKEAIANMPKRAARPASAPQNMSLAENPVYQQMRIALSSAEAEVAVLEARLEEHQKRREDLRRLVDTVPKVEAEMARLNRDYDIHQKNYAELVKRREQLEIGDEAGRTTDDVQFRIIEPPREPLVPVSPDRPKLSALVLVVGLGGGVGFAWLLAMLRPAVFTQDNLKEFTDLPVLGVVSRVLTPRELVRRRLSHVSFVFGCCVLFALFGGLLAVQNMDLDVIAKLKGLGGRFL